MFLSRRRDAMQQVIDNPPKSAVQLDEAIALHMQIAMEMQMFVILTGCEREEIEGELSLLKQMWELIEIGLQTDFEDADEPPPPPMIMPTFVPGNMTLH
jgi:hypothetical protein